MKIVYVSSKIQMNTVKEALTMQIDSVPLSSNNRLIELYRNMDENIMHYFDYHPYEDFALRAEHIDNQHYNRETLSNILYEMNQQWGAPTSSLRQINRLRENDSLVVIGGQQAGLLTGPLYSINKLISIVQIAREQERILNRPVIPVFWIAGEDHDLDEINHIFTVKDNEIYKHRLVTEVNNKKSVSHLDLNPVEVEKWLKQAFGDLQETSYTKELFEEISKCLAMSETYVDFFASLIFKLFPDEGIVLIDSAHHNVRKLESDFFKELILQRCQISESVYQTEQQLNQAGYAIPLGAEQEDAHLFFHDEYNERILLKFEDGVWVGKNDEVSLTTDELLEVAMEQPERLSNNVVTRPLAQEYLFPTLAFVGGDGEISYWATLKGAFHAVGFYMPPVLRRMSFTYQTERTSKLLNVRVLNSPDVIRNGVEKEKMNWLQSQTTPPIDQLFHEASKQITDIHEPLRKLAQQISFDLEEEANKNLEYMKANLSYLQRKTNQKLTEYNEQALMQFTEICNELKPNGSLQERTWSPLPFVNEYGVTFLRQLIRQETLTIKDGHYIVTL